MNTEVEEDERTRAALNSLDTEYDKAQDSTYGLMVRYVQQHPDEFE
jgi:hypothetical protein